MDCFSTNGFQDKISSGSASSNKTFLPLVQNLIKKTEAANQMRGLIVFTFMSFAEIEFMNLSVMSSNLLEVQAFI